MSPSVVDPFIGRESEMIELGASLDDALNGHSRIAMISGEPGIGKTRLSDEIKSHGVYRGAIGLTGVCLEGDIAPPFWPWVD